MGAPKQFFVLDRLWGLIIRHCAKIRQQADHAVIVTPNDLFQSRTYRDLYSQFFPQLTDERRCG